MRQKDSVIRRDSLNDQPTDHQVTIDNFGRGKTEGPLSILRRSTVVTLVNGSVRRQVGGTEMC